MTVRSHSRRTNLLAVFSVIGLFALSTGCEEETRPPPVDVPRGPCGHALYVVASDYQSTSVSIVSFDGEVLSPAFLTSGSADPGLSVALSGDVVAPTQPHFDELLLIDRTPTGVLTFADPATGDVSLQANISTGFASNPQDAVRLSNGMLAVARYGENPNPGAEPFDTGSDILIIDADQTPSGRIDLAPLLDDPELLPSPARVVRAGLNGADLVVLLAAYSKDFTLVGDGRVAFFDEGSLALSSVVTLKGGFGCGAISVSPNGERIAITCSGKFGGTSTPDPMGSALYILDRANTEWKLTTRHGALDLGGEPLGASVALIDENTALISSLGRFLEPGQLKQEVPDRLLRVQLASGEFEVLLETETTPFSYGDMRCCGDSCFLADADRNVVHRLVDGAPTETISLDDGTGLPPRFLGVY